MQQLSLGLTDKTGLCAYAPVTSTYTSAPSSNVLRFMYNVKYKFPVPGKPHEQRGSEPVYFLSKNNSIF